MIKEIFSRLLVLLFICVFSTEVRADSIHVQLKSLSVPKAVRQDPPVLYTLWNGYVQNINILEIMNPTSGTKKATVRVISPKGRVLKSISFDLKPSQQRDLIINDLVNIKNSYGIIEVEPDIFTGRLFYYRITPDTPNYDYAFSLPLQKPMRDKTNVAFNTFNPSKKSADSKNLVANWLSIVNLEEEDEAKFTVKKYDQYGKLLSKKDYLIPARGRFDIDGGHVVPGPRNVGLNVIIPQDTGKRYLAQLVRYGYKNPQGDPGPGFEFAFPLIAKPGTAKTQFAPLTVGYVRGINWVELVNVSDKPNKLKVLLTDNLGEMLHEKEYALAPFAQHHIYVNSYLLAASGRVKIQSTGGGKFIAQSMFYFYDDVDDSIAVVSGTQSSDYAYSALSGSYNLFIDQWSFVRLLNTTDKNIFGTLTGYYPNGKSKTIDIWVPAKGTMELGTHTYEPFFFAENTYGVVKVSVDGPVQGEVLRNRLEDVGVLDIYAPTEMKGR